MRLTFRGAAGTVTGSLHQLDVDGDRFLLDCGLFQGRRAEAREINSRFAFPPETVSGVILSHAHIDHSGNLPSLVKRGFGGPIWATPATADLCSYMLPDSGHIQEKDAEYLNRRQSRRRRIEPDYAESTVEPLYTLEDAKAVQPLFQPTPYNQPTAVSDRLSFELYDAGHILGSASVLLHLRDGRRPIRLAFSGDVGRPGLPIIRDPHPLPPVDYLILESTYGGRLHRRAEDVRARLAGVIARTAQRGGRIITPAFAVGRTQQLVLLLHDLAHAGGIPEIPIFVDSPLAADVTAVYRAHPECYDAEARNFLLDQRDPFGFQRLRYTRSVEESKALNDLAYPFMVIAAAGMCEAGRILHHLKNNVTDPRNTVLITGYQAENTLGRKLLEGDPEPRIFGLPTRVRAEVTKLNELSAHADQRELLEWVRPLAPTLKKIFLVHGEPAQADLLAAALQERYGVETAVAQPGDSVELTAA